jgi:hypothetical protein
MSTLRFGAKPITAVRLGAKPVSRIMLGRTTVWNAVQVYDDFNRPDAELDDDGSWVNHGPSLDHVASVVDNRCRIGIPDNFTAGVFERISYMRYAKATSPTEDGYVEALVATMGDSTKTLLGDINYQTHVYGRVSNTGFNAGVGIWLAASEIGLIVRQGLKETVVARFGAYSPGNIVRLEWKGKLYTMFRDGVSLGTWNDSTNMVATGTGNRSLGLRVHGAKEKLGLGPRRFSAALDYVEYG